MAKNNLLKEAIADAKAVRETAIENAKLALQEAFIPTVKSLLSKKIQMEMEDDIPDEELEDDEEAVEEEEESELAVEPEEGEEEAEEEEKVEEEDIDLNIEEEGGEGEEEAEEEEKVEEEEDIDDDEEDLDLEAILKELEDDDEEEVPEPELEDDEESVEEEEDIDLDIEDDDEEEDIDLENVLNALSEDDDEEEEEKEDTVELEQLKKENENYRQTLEYLRSKLNEINLLNAKLLFTNKVFKKQTLSNNQKLAVVEQFDRAHNLREIKLVYTTLIETFTGTKVRLKKTKGSASKVTASTKSKKSTEVLVEGANLRDRFKKLANLKK